MPANPKHDGGAAFPISLPGWGDNGACGMSLRDHFAGQVLVGLVTYENGERLDKLFGSGRTDDCSPQRYFAEIAYSIADAMLAEREKSDD